MTMGKAGPTVCRLGLSASYWPGKKTVYKAVDEGINVFFCFGTDKQMTSVLRDVLRRDRQKHYVVTGAYNLLW